jgi:hypothetical protein
MHKAGLDPRAWGRGVVRASGGAEPAGLVGRVPVVAREDGQLADGGLEPGERLVNLGCDRNTAETCRHLS